MPDKESVGVRITVQSKLEKRRALINGELPTPEQLEALDRGEEIEGLTYELYDTIYTEPEEHIISQEQLSFLQGSTENGTN